MALRALAVVLGGVAVAACYQPTPPEGAPCASNAECPASLTCFDGHCRSAAPELDARPTGDGPVTGDAPLPGACPAFALQCDGFEGTDLAGWNLQISDPKGSLGLTDAISLAGGQALDATMPGLPSSGASAYVAREVPIGTTGMLATRAWINAPQTITNFSGVIIFDGPGGYALVSGDNERRWSLSEQSLAGLFDHQSTIATEANRWTCVELDYSFSPRRVQVYIDDVLAIDITPNDPAPAFTRAGAGVTRAPVAGFHVFVDEVVIATQHIGCQ
ncbi:MAG TPA: hypothetical protein VFQ53_02320 [Kofleriaceae bacterium]|nr:hypothetical protein [Kofleriaceae bacterium]